jgi:hypothetical protein
MFDFLNKFNRINNMESFAALGFVATNGHFFELSRTFRYRRTDRYTRGATATVMGGSIP